jgi:streptogramin lyase
MALVAVVAALGAGGATAAKPKQEKEKLPSSPGLAKVTQYELLPDDLFPRAIAAGPERGPDEMWFAVGKGQPGRSALEQEVQPVIGRISFTGEIREFPLPGLPPVRGVANVPYALAAGNDGAMWYLRQGAVGRITHDGEVTEIPLDTGDYPVGEIVSGSDGNLWFAKRDMGAAGSIVRLTLSGQSTEFPLPGQTGGPEGIVPGPDGNLWFTEELGERIGRITQAGAITEFPIGSPPADIAAGHDGNLWYSTRGAIGHISTTGKVFEPILVEGGFGPLAAGPDLRLWFGNAGGRALGRVTPDGRRSLTELPKPAMSPVDLATGTLGSLWYIAGAETDCSGGRSCQALQPVQPAQIGHIQQIHPIVVIKRRGFSIHPRWARVRLGCLGGEALGHCRGDLALRNRAGDVFGHRRFLIRTDDSATIPIRLLREGREAVLDGKRLRLVAHVDHPEGTPTSRGFTVPAKPRP